MPVSVTNSYCKSTTTGYPALLHDGGMPISHLDFARRFKEACKAAGLPATQKELGKVFGVSGVMVNYYRNGEKLPSMERAIEMAEILGVCVEWLLTGRGPRTPPDAKEGAADQMDLSGLSSESKALIRALRDSLSKSVGKASNHDD